MTKTKDKIADKLQEYADMCRTGGFSRGDLDVIDAKGLSILRDNLDDFFDEVAEEL